MIQLLSITIKCNDEISHNTLVCGFRHVKIIQIYDSVTAERLRVIIGNNEKKNQIKAVSITTVQLYSINSQLATQQRWAQLRITSLIPTTGISDLSPNRGCGKLP